ncbi:MAG: response regulator [Nitrosomonadales bacterium]|nr:response regulator [Nitrosomonadales bacterium]
MKLLLVEQSDAVRARISQLFEGLSGLSVRHVSSLDQARQCFAEFNPELVVTDVQLPGGNGLDLLQFIQERHSAALTIFITNHIFYQRRCMAGGAYRFFDKSLDMEKMLQVIRELTQQEGENGQRRTVA